MGWLFPEEINYFEKLRGRNINGRNGKSVLILTRALSLVALLAHFIDCMILIQGKDYFNFFTNWGNFLTMWCFALLLLSLFIENANSVFHKIAYVAFEVIFSSNCVIALFFWAVLSWMMWDQIFINIHSSFIMTLAHSLSITLMIIDFKLNQIFFHWHHVVFTIGVPLIYLCWYVVMVFALDFTPYPVLTLKDWFSLPISILLCGMFIGLGRLLSRKRENEESNSRILDKNLI